MSDIDKMNFNQLRNEVQLLRDELAIFKRKYEDIIYNLDNDNFSSRLIKEKEGMKTSIEFNAEGIKTKVSNEDLTGALKNYSTITQTANAIETAVTSINETTDEKLKSYSTITQTADAIVTAVSSLESADSLLKGQISEIKQTANIISSKVGEIENGKFGKYSLFTQTAEGFTLDGKKTTFTGVIYLTDTNNEKLTSIWSSSNNGRHLYMNSAYNPENKKMDYVHIGDNIDAFDYDTDTYEESHNVYVGSSTGTGDTSWKVATEGWVKKKIATSGGGGVAKFA